jgi:hypothetical protein
MRSRIVRWVATTVVAAVIGAALVVAPAQSSPAQAAWEKNAPAWTSAMNSSLATLSKAFGWEKTFFGPAGNIALAILGPLIASVLGTGEPGISDVMNELDDIEHEIDRMEQSLDRIERDVLQVDIDVLMGTCNVETSQLSSYMTILQEAQEDYAKILEVVSEMKPDDNGAVFEQYVNDFIDTTMGTHNVVGSTPMATQIRDVHNALVSTNGYKGIIEVCGQAYLQDWRTSVATQIATTDKDVAGVWLDDQQYYDRMVELVQFWQTAEAQGSFLLQQAALVKATAEYVGVATLDIDDSENVCYNAKQDPAQAAATVLCDSGYAFGKTLYADFLHEWQQAGVPYSDDQVVMSLGSDVTGYLDPNKVSVPSTVWARTPDSVGASWSTGTWDTHATPVSYLGLPMGAATGAQWTALGQSYEASHPAHLARTPAFQSPWRPSYSQPFAVTGVPEYKPVDVLGLMGSVTTAVGEPTAFDPTGVRMVWIPQETVERQNIDYGSLHWENVWQYTYYTDFPATAFPPSVVQSNVTFDEGSSFHHYILTYYADSPVTLRCSVMPVDGVLCDKGTVAGWWTVRQTTDITVPSINDFTGNYTGVGTYTVTPTDSTLGTFTGTGTDKSCTGGEPCGILFNDSIGAMPPWVESFAPTVGQAGGGPLTEETIWPAANVATEADCGASAHSIWGVPSRCGQAFDGWATAYIPDPTKTGPEIAAEPAVTAGAAGQAVCVAPEWNADDPSTIVYDDAQWTIVTPTGATHTQTSAHGTAADLAALVKTAGYTDLSSLQVSCTETGHVKDVANRTTAASSPVTAELVDGVWTVKGVPNAPGGSEPGSGGGGGTGGDPAGSGSGSGSGSGAGAGAGAGADSSAVSSSGDRAQGGLAATGSDPLPITVLAILVALAGAAMIRIATRYRRRHQ